MLLHRLHRGRGGFTLVEVLLSVVILGSLLGTVFVVQKQGQSAAVASQAQLQASLKASRLLDRVVRELQSMGSDAATPVQSTSLGTDTLDWQVSLGVTGGAVQWSNTNRFALAMAPGEADNGVDDDGDGLVDERALVLTYEVGTANQRSVTLCDAVAELAPRETANALDDNGNGVADERGFNLHRTGDILEVRITVQGTGPEGSVVSASVETSFRVRN
ncbi:MAG: prepilin-type N-terminal cleavage/methylation domain-containing protein [Planctomycetes bacterium]|nr:prepilin-type N-terminal cleavage/methylation domain-containing protein [Planctomycetota bacterium]